MFLSLFIRGALGVTELQPDNIEIKATVTRGMIIDAGSGGSRLHVYHWQPRIFNTIPPDLSFPTTDEQWTVRMAPGIAEYMNNPEDVKKQLAPLIDFATRTLVGLEESFEYFPIFFKATGGMRELNLKQREEIMRWVRYYLSDKSFCPFYFHDDFARVISGEEEAIYSWAAINFLKGDLLSESKGIGTANGGKEGTFGTVDLGGASSQIAFYVKNQDISENLFKLQIGGQKHWNVYTKSFLSFGHVSARKRHLTSVADTALKNQESSTAEVPFGMSYCLHTGYTELVQIPGLSTNTETKPETSKNRSKGKGSYSATPINPQSTTPNYPHYTADQIEVSGPTGPAADQFERCLKALRPLLEKDHAHLCMQVYDGECSIDGAYQPILPDDGRFIGTSSYLLPWEILDLPDTASLELYKKRAIDICSMSFQDVTQYFDQRGLVDADSKLQEMLPYFCFLSSYAYVLLVDGYGFHKNSTLTVLDQVNGNKVGWPLGAILYEINSLPWELEQTVPREPWGLFFLAVTIGLLFGAVASFYLSKELHLENRNPFASLSNLTKYNDLTKYNENIDYSDVYPNPAPMISITPNGSDDTHSDNNVNVTENNSVISDVDTKYSICNQIDTRRPFAIGSEDTSECKLNDYESTNLKINNHMDISHNSHENANPVWPSKLTQYNPFISNKDRYQRIPEVPDI